jgi:hypothetical protein
VSPRLVCADDQPAFLCVQRQNRLARRYQKKVFRNARWRMPRQRARPELPRVTAKQRVFSVRAQRTPLGTGQQYCPAAL